ncbi:MAG: HEAT repeat domain-containing protein, partial [Chloroflexota bacterium]
ERAVVQVLDYGADAVEPLMEALDSDNANVRHMAVWALGEIGDMRSVQPHLHHSPAPAQQHVHGCLDFHF